MGQRVSSCLRRHRRKLFIIGGMVGGVVILNGFMKKRFMQWQKEKAIECFEQLKKQSHFDATLQTCDSAIPTFLPKIREIISDALDVKPIIEELRQKPPNKLELWDELRVLVFTQMVTEIYAHCLLVVLMRVQISILGGYVYSDYHKKDSSIAEGNQQKYMSTISNFFLSGINRLTFPVEDAVRKVLRDVRLNDTLKLKDFQKLFRDISYNISQGRDEVLPDIQQYLMLPDFENEESASNDPVMQKIVNETKDILECSDFNRVMSCCLEHGISVMLDRVSECYMHLSTGTENFTNPNDMCVPLAKVIPTLHNVVSNHKPSENDSLIHALLQNESLKSFSANLYEAFSHETM